MGARLESAIHIERPIAEVFAFALDLEQSFRAFDPDIETVTRSPTGPIGPGTQFVLCQTVLGRQFRARVVYTAVSADRAVEFEASAGPLSTTGVLSFEPAARGTLVRFLGDARPTGPFNVFSPVTKRIIGRVWKNRLRRLKVTLESRAPPSVG